MAFNTNDLFDAVDTIVNSRIKKLEYDQTVEAKIVSTTQKGEGIYKVEYQSAIFDAYANDSSSYYENEVVYVMIPKGDFTKQKYIIGRKVEKKPGEAEYSFNFKMPFDNFIALENLTENSTIDTKGYLANKPTHGCKDDVLSLELLKTLTEEEVNLQNQINAKSRALEVLEHNYQTVTLQSLNEHASENTGTLLNAYKYNTEQTFLQALVTKVNEVCQISSALQNIGIYDPYWEWYLHQTAAECAIPKKDLAELTTAAYGAYSKTRALIEADIIELERRFNASVEDRYEQLVYNANTTNLLWSWSRPTENGDYAPVFETKLGIGIDFRTLLGTYRPISGDYGLRILITGMTRPTEEVSATVVTEEVYLRKEDMYGNTYAFYEPYVQQKIFDISSFLCVQRIDIFFWQDHDFIDYTGRTIPYLDEAQSEDSEPIELPPNIFCSDLVVQFGLTADECKSDHVFLYTYNDVHYGYDPYSEHEMYEDYQWEVATINNDDTLTDEEQLQALAELKARYLAKGAAWLQKERYLQMAWVHIDPEDGPILINHIDYQPADNVNDKQSLRYWQKKYDVKIQWYHYVYDCPRDATSLPERQGGINWVYLKEYNPSPLEVLEPDQWQTKVDSVFNIKVIPDELKAKEKWKVIVSVNDVGRESEPLVFTNKDITVETGAFESLNEIVFKVLREKRETLSTGESHYTIIEDNTLRDFYVYDINDQCIKNEDNVYYSDLNYYLQVWIRDNDTGEYSPMTYDPDLGMDEIIWHWPESNSMIASWGECSDEELTNAVLAPTIDYASDAYNDQIKNITRRFKIKREWHAAQTNNTVSATIKRRNKTYHATLLLNFGPSSSMGTDYVLTVSQRRPAGTMFVKGMPFSIEAVVRNKTGNTDANGKYRFTWELLSPTIVTVGTDDPLSATDWELSNADGFINNVLSGVVRNDQPPIFKVTVDGAADYPISQVAGFRLCNHASIAENYTVAACAERVEFKSDGSVPITYYGTFEVNCIQNEQRFDTWPTWTYTQWKREPGTAWSDEVINSPRFLNQGALELPDYFDIKTSVEPNKLLNSNRTIPMWCIDTTQEHLLDGPYSLTANKDGVTYSYGTSLIELQNKIWDAYNKTVEDANASNQAGSPELEDLLREADELKTTRLTALYSVANLVVPGYVVYALNPYVKNENVTDNVGWYWEEGMDTNYYSVLGFEIHDYVVNGEKGWFKQAVPFTRNLYSSSLLNSWDGKLFLDEENNALLAQMVSAGTKDKNGLFTGVIMGNWASVSDSSLDIPGLYGLKDGGQVFGFKTNGTGFIGKSGRGRILFDGNQSLISNVDKTCYINLDPVLYTSTSNGATVNGNYRGYSTYFLYSEAKKTSTASLDGEQKLEESTQWAAPYFNDSSKDYFIVDPNNGILTTGGIVSRYGRIGNWMISAAGLYQKAERENALSSRYMYLGFNGLTAAALADIKARYQDAYDALEARRQIAIDAARAKYLLDEFKLIGQYLEQIYDTDPVHYWNYGWPFEDFSKALSETLTEINEYTPAVNIKERLQANIKREIEADKRTGYHLHYAQGYPLPVNPEIYTGANLVLSHLVSPMWVQEPDWYTIETLTEWVQNNQFTGDAHYTVYWSDPTPPEPEPDDPGEGGDTPGGDTPGGDPVDPEPTSGVQYRYKWFYDETYNGENDGYTTVSEAQVAAINDIMTRFMLAEQAFEDPNSARYQQVHQQYIEALSHWLDVMDNINNGTDNTIEAYTVTYEEAPPDSGTHEEPVEPEPIYTIVEPEVDTTIYGHYYIITLPNPDDQEITPGWVIGKTYSGRQYYWHERNAKNVSADIYQDTPYYTMEIGGDIAYLYEIYNTVESAIVVRSNASGYNNYEAAVAASKLILEDEHGVAITYNVNTGKWYLIEGGVILTPPSASGDEGGGGGGGQGSGGGGGGDQGEEGEGPQGPSIPQYTNTYYSLRPELFPVGPKMDWYDDDYRNSLGAPDISVSTFEWSNEETYTLDRIYTVLKQSNAIYKYYLLAYAKQLTEQIERGLSTLEDEQRNAYEIRVRENSVALAQYISEVIDPDYERLKAQLDAMVEAAKDAEIIASNDRYAMYVGYLSPESANLDKLLQPYTDAQQNKIKMPLFSISWRGAVTMREALIGYDSPWLVTDYGLTQSNNFGTIFLGNPQRPDNMQSWSTLGGGLIQYQGGSRLSGGFENNILQIHPDDHKTEHTNSEIVGRIASLFNTLPTKAEIEEDRKVNGNMNATTYLASYKALIPFVYGEYGNFAIQAGNVPKYYLDGTLREWDRKVHFGVRMDGTLFSDRGLIGGWRITSTRLASYKDDLPCLINTSGEAHLTDEGKYEFFESYKHNISSGHDLTHLTEAEETAWNAAVDALDLKEYIALDTEANEIRLSNSQIVLDGNDGTVFIGKRSKNFTEGQMYLATHHFIGRSGATFVYQDSGVRDDGTIEVSATSQGTRVVSSLEQTENEAPQGTFVSSWTYTSYSLSNVPTIIASPAADTSGDEQGRINFEGNELFIQEELNSVSSPEYGIKIRNLQQYSEDSQHNHAYGSLIHTELLPLIEKPAGSSTTSERVVSAWLGNPKNPWNLYAQSIYARAKSIWMGGQLVATQDWVVDICTKINGNIIELDEELSSQLARINSVLSQLWALVKANFGGNLSAGKITGYDPEGNPIYSAGTGHGSLVIDSWTHSLTNTSNKLKSVLAIEGNTMNSNEVDVITEATITCSQDSFEMTINDQPVTVSGWAEALKATFKAGWEAALASVENADMHLYYSGYSDNTSGTVTVQGVLTFPSNEGSGASGKTFTRTGSITYTYTPNNDRHYAYNSGTKVTVDGVDYYSGASLGTNSGHVASSSLTFSGLGYTD